MNARSPATKETGKSKGPFDMESSGSPQHNVPGHQLFHSTIVREPEDGYNDDKTGQADKTQCEIQETESLSDMSSKNDEVLRSPLCWVNGFFQSCQRDSVQLAQQLVDHCKHDEISSARLESLAHQVLQKLLLSGTSLLYPPQESIIPKSATDYNTDGTKKNFASPYSVDFHREYTEKAFQIFDILTRPSADASARQEKRKLLFGSPLGDRVVLTRDGIQKSGMLFCPHWRLEFEIPDELLLLCLDKRKFVSADVPSLKQVAQEFDLWNLLPDLLDDLGLDTDEWFSDLYYKTRDKDGWQSSSKVVLHCLLFVCRTYRCMQALKWTSIRGSLAEEVKRCLGILQHHAQKEPKSRSKAGPARNRYQTMTLEAKTSFRPPSRVSDSSEYAGDVFLSSDSDGDDDNDEEEDWQPSDDETRPTEQPRKIEQHLKNCSEKDQLIARLPSATGPRKEMTVSIRSSPEKENRIAETTRNGKSSSTKAVHNSPHEHVASNTQVDSESIEYKCYQLTHRQAMTEIPVEKLCIARGTVIQRFVNAEAALFSMASPKCARSLQKALLGMDADAEGNDPHTYKGYFWRFQDSNSAPSKRKGNQNGRGKELGLTAGAFPSRREKCQNKVPGLRLAQVADSGNDKMTSLARSPGGCEKIEVLAQCLSSIDVKKMPVEKLCVQTGRILQTFETALEAHQSVSTSSRSFHYFKRILTGNHPHSTGVPNVYLRFFWRLKGSTRVPVLTASVPPAAQPSKEDQESYSQLAKIPSNIQDDSHSRSGTKRKLAEDPVENV